MAKKHEECQEMQGNAMKHNKIPGNRRGRGPGPGYYLFRIICWFSIFRVTHLLF